MKAIALSLVHVGINPETAEEMDAMRGFIRDVLGMEEGQETPISWFGAGNRIEFMKEKGRGTKGHLGFYTPNMDQAIRELKAQGYSFDQDSAQYDEDGSLRLIYLTEEINGFAIHLLSTES